MSGPGLWLRRTHRWVSMVFTLTVLANFVAMAKGVPPAWVTYAPLASLSVLLLTGLYLFVQTWLGHGRGGTRKA